MDLPAAAAALRVADPSSAVGPLEVRAGLRRLGFEAAMRDVEAAYRNLRG